MVTRKNAARKSPARAGADSVHILDITLLEVFPPVWRRIAVPSHFTLGQLHRVLQVAMGWTDSHLHQFKVGDTLYSDPTFEMDELDQEVGDEESVTVADALPRKESRALYEYDFGDGWEHLLQVEKVCPREPGMKAPECLNGARACPPEDSGGPLSYPELLEALRDPRHEEHEELLEWLGGGFDPEAFDLESVSRELRRLQ